MAAFTFKPMGLPGLLLIEGKLFPDERGFFLEAYRESELTAAGIPPRLVQDNVSRSAKGTLRGLHYQKSPAAQGKLMRCLRGKVFDVAVDIRKGSSTYGRWEAVELSDERNMMLWIPEGFAHGFFVLSDSADILYKTTDYFSLENDRGIRWDDPAVAVRWPSTQVKLSPKDARLPLLADADNDFAWTPGPGP
ncbi:MAG: dTDP-4-dehydrorhamnose 3,5-epimerase [Elusimicrobia bacterium]|nr:dTDP-4-dehydrorhamnose 3,5-epimerase [Elusimicrobiota bacterium]